MKLAALALAVLASLQPAVSGWEPVGLSGGGGMFSPAISPANPNLMMLNCDMSAAYISEDGGHNWRMIHHAQLRSDTRCRPAFHPSNPSVIYASSGGELRVSRDRGRTFSPIGDLHESLSGEIAINPTDPSEMLAGTDNGRCHLSRDAGVTWTTCEGPRGQVLGFHFRSRTLFVGTSEGIWRSDDDGRTWVEKANGLPWKEIRGFAGGEDRLYCTVTSKLENDVLQGGVYRSLDSGESWQRTMGQGINVDTTSADQWSFGPIAQY
ncbi:MAG: hypothetical protein ABFE01_04960, partial [Phycisphaerales bacterium]